MFLSWFVKWPSANQSARFKFTCVRFRSVPSSLNNTRPFWAEHTCSSAALNQARIEHLSLWFCFGFFSVVMANIGVPRLFRRFMSAAMANPKCFFDVTAGGAQVGRIVMEVFIIIDSAGRLIVIVHACCRMIWRVPTEISYFLSLDRVFVIA